MATRRTRDELGKLIQVANERMKRSHKTSDHYSAAAAQTRCPYCDGTHPSPYYEELCAQKFHARHQDWFA